MKDQIRTKWHKILPLVESGEIYVTPAPGEKARPASDYGFDAAVFAKLVDECSRLPHFVIDRELVELVPTKAAQRSLLDLKRAELLHLPYKRMVVEYENEYKSPHGTTRQMFGLVRELSPEERKEFPEAQFAGIRLSLEHDGEGPYLIISPSVVTIGIHEKEGLSEPWLHLGGMAMVLFSDQDKARETARRTHTKDGATIFYAVASAILLSGTFGVEKKTIECEQLNKRRALSNKPAIPSYTYLHIGRVYHNAHSNESVVYDARKSPRPHWRRGHVRNVHYGEGRTKLRLAWIPGRIVAFRDDMTATEPKAPEYIVRR